ncbi:DNA oxidative demethylase AlkB [Edaphovirga cremea]|uniref:DNA oxidative demethylase AlkB n=1 Tax=Edaphovirga cremea TaxID=2267246 RepID=UPI000DEEFA35|nr:DNA oxidative demethylase AlkB [Edaphovirga cremea]
MNLDLFDDPPLWEERISEGTVVLRGFALARQEEVLAAVQQVVAQSPFRHMVTPGGYTMSAAMSSCGQLGWVTDASGYRYTRQDPLTGNPWPAMPDTLLHLAISAAERAGYPGFQPDACLINRYDPPAKMALHQDKNEQDFSQPVVSLSFGLPVVFQFGGMERSDKTQKIVLTHGDVLVWGGVDRLRYHGVLPLKAGIHPLVGEHRINLTFRKAGRLSDLI